MPDLSIVVAAWNGVGPLRDCLASLRGQRDGEDIEVVVVRNFEVTGDLAAELPGCVDLPLPAGTTVPALRGAGLTRARAPVVAFIEDHCTCEAGWTAALRLAHERHEAVGGPVEQGSGASRLDWAVYFYDYGRYMPPCAAGPVEQLSGLNMSFKRDLLAATLGASSVGIFEAELQAELRRRGRLLYLEPVAVVTHRGHHSAGEAMAQAFRLARGYAARRLAGASGLRRGAYGAGSLLLPAILGARIVAATLQKRRHRGALIGALPWLAVLLAAWSAGEVAGYLAGPGQKPATSS